MSQSTGDGEASARDDISEPSAHFASSHSADQAYWRFQLQIRARLQKKSSLTLFPQHHHLRPRPLAVSKSSARDPEVSRRHLRLGLARSQFRAAKPTERSKRSARRRPPRSNPARTDKSALLEQAKPTKPTFFTNSPKLPSKWRTSAASLSTCKRMPRSQPERRTHTRPWQTWRRLLRRKLKDDRCTSAISRERASPTSRPKTTHTANETPPKRTNRLTSNSSQ